MADNLPQSSQSGQVMAIPDSKVALDQHFARALSAKPPSPPCDCYIQPMEPFGESAQQIQRYHHSRNRVNALKRHIPVFPSDASLLLPKRPRFSFPQALPPCHQYVVPAPYYRAVPNMMIPLTPITPNSCMVGPMTPISPPSFHQRPIQGWYPTEHRPPHMRPPSKGGFVYPEFSQFLFHPEVDSFKDIPLLPGESNSDEEQDTVVLQPLTEQSGESWVNLAAGDTYENAPYVSPTTSRAASVMDDLRMTDQQLDDILELKGEI